jgi:hypothetical protein
MPHGRQTTLDGQQKYFEYVLRRAASPPVNRHAKTNPFKERTTVMSHVTTTLSAGVIAAVLAAAVTSASAAAPAPDKAAVKQATATCKAQVKEQAKYNEMSWYARHKAVKSCVADALAKH